jgi:NADPH:quinone reductase-like Zn-dependent oxidoreductase
VYGGMGGLKVPTADFSKLLYLRASILMTTLRTRSTEYKTALIKDLKDKCEEGFKNGKLVPIIDKVFKLSEAAEAHKYMESNASIGKIIMTCDL